VGGFIKNFTGLYRSKLGDGPNVIYLLRTQIGIVSHRTRSCTSHVREETYKS